MNKRTKALQYTKETAYKVAERDNHECLFCKMGYHLEGINKSGLGSIVYDIAHFINRSQGGLGIEENLVLLCRYHHGHLDNSNKGYRKEMLSIIEDYLKSIYPEWDKERLVYKKYGDLERH